MNKGSQLEIGLVDIAGVLFVVGGVASLVMSFLTISFVSLALPLAFSTVFIVVLTISLLCSLGAVHCYMLVTKRMLSEAGIRGMITGGLLLFFGFGFIGSFSVATTTTYLLEISAALVLVGGVICFILQHTTLTPSPMVHQQPTQHRT
jgi:hypothetical protein